MHDMRTSPETIEGRLRDERMEFHWFKDELGCVFHA